MLQEVGRLGPIGCESHEPHHLLAATEIVDDGCSGCRGKGAGRVGAEYVNGLSYRRVGDDCWKVP